MELRRIKQVFKYGKSHAKEIAALDTVSKGWFAIYIDILHCYNKYGMWSNQYKKEKFWELTTERRNDIGNRYKSENDYRNRWVKEFFNNYKFLQKWSSLKYEHSASLQEKRRSAYAHYFGLSEDCFIGYGVIIHKHHYSDSYISVGKKCLIAEECSIDYTGGLMMGNQVSLSEGVKILTHNHELDYEKSDVKKGVVLTPLEICDKVWVGTKALIMPGVRQVGRGAIVSAGAVVYQRVPPYAVVQGNPAKIIGFRFTPREVVERESKIYSEDERIPYDELVKNYEKYFIKRIKEIKEFIKI